MNKQDADAILEEFIEGITVYDGDIEEGVQANIARILDDILHSLVSEDGEVICTYCNQSSCVCYQEAPDTIIQLSTKPKETDTEIAKRLYEEYYGDENTFEYRQDRGCSRLELDRYYIIDFDDWLDKESEHE